jgi:hypothetical protein
MLKSVTADKRFPMLLYALYYTVVGLSILGTIIVTKNALALVGLLFLLFTNHVVPPPQSYSQTDAQGQPIGFTAELSDD